MITKRLETRFFYMFEQMGNLFQISVDTSAPSMTLNSTAFQFPSPIIPIEVTHHE